MTVYSSKRVPETVINDCNERIVWHGLAVIQSEAAEKRDDDDQGGGSGSNGNQQLVATKAKNNQGSLLIGATCAPADIRHPTDLSLLNEAREDMELFSQVETH